MVDGHLACVEWQFEKLPKEQTPRNEPATLVRKLSAGNECPLFGRLPYRLGRQLNIREGPSIMAFLVAPRGDAAPPPMATKSPVLTNAAKPTNVRIS